MNHQEMLKSAQEEVSARALRIKGMWSEDAIDCEYDKAFGYIIACNNLEVFDREQFEAAVDVLNAALRESTQKNRPGAGNTESGKDKSTISSVDETCGLVKGGGSTC